MTITNQKSDQKSDSKTATTDPQKQGGETPTKEQKKQETIENTVMGVEEPSEDEIIANCIIMIAETASILEKIKQDKCVLAVGKLKGAIIKLQK